MGGVEWIGWVATAIFTSSYLFRRPQVLRLVQMGGALVWMAYGAVLGAIPIVAANALVFGAAGAAAWRERRASGAIASAS